MKKKLILAGTLMFLFSVCNFMSLIAQEAAPAAAPAGGADLQIHTQKSLWQLMKSGGWAMFPLGACSVITVGLTILNAQRIRMGKLVPPDIISQLKVAAKERNLQLLVELSSSSDSLFTKSLSTGLKSLDPEDPVKSRPKVEQGISETMGREESKYAFFVNFLSLMTSMSPMWGLLGTVSGMIGAFSKIGGGGMGKPEQLAANISEALVCTATGLMIAICAMGFYFLFRNMLNTIVKESEAHFTEILDNLTGSGETLSLASQEQSAE